MRRSLPIGSVLVVLLLLTTTGAIAASPGLPDPAGLSGQSTLLRGPYAAVPDTEPGAGLGAARAGTAAAPAELSIIVTFKPADPAGLSLFLRDLSDPSSTLFHQYLSGRQFDDRFGSSPKVYDAGRSYFEAAGVSGLTSYNDRTTLSFTATPAQIQTLFHVGIATLEDARGRTFYAPGGPPNLPIGLASQIAGVQGLSDYSRFLLHTDFHAKLVGAPPARHSGSPSPVSPSFRSTPCSTAGGPFTCIKVGGRSYPAPFGNLTAASDLQVTYGTAGLYTASGYPSKTSVASILWVNPIDNSSGAGAYCSSLSSTNYAASFLPSDLSSFFSYTLPSNEPKPHAIGVPIRTGAGQAPPPGRSASCDSGGNEFESTLDLDMIGSLAPGANLFEVYGNGGNSGTTDLAFADILNPNSSEGAGMTASTIAGLANVSVISNSWGYQVFNDTSWYADLQQAQARGISVLAATPDSGDNSSNAPAGQAYGSFGDVAVGGTTIRLSNVTLARTSEIAWYEGAGSHYGSGGGIADVTNPSLGCGIGPAKCFPEPPWQSGSVDANAVVRSVGPGRGEPDISAMANDTVLSLTHAGVNYSITCLVMGCSFFIFSGNSVATPIEAGVLDSIDHALNRSGLPTVGFLDPLAYALGQGQFDGNITSKLPFFDVNQYGNANFSAVAGYDLVTGWGPINAQNLSAYLMPHNVTFLESGLPAGTPWSVTIGGTTVGSTSTTVTFQLPFGSYRFSVQKVVGFTAHPSHGTVPVKLASRTIPIKYR